MIKEDAIRDIYYAMLNESLDQRELEVELGVGLGPGIKKFAMRGDEITLTGQPKDTGKYTATVKVIGKNAKAKVVVGKINQKLAVRMVDAFDKQGIDLTFEK